MRERARIDDVFACSSSGRPRAVRRAMEDAEFLLPVIKVSNAGRNAVNGSVVAVYRRVCRGRGESSSTPGILWEGSRHGIM